MDSTKRKLSTSFITNVASSMGQDMNNFVLVKHYGKFSIDMEDARNAMMLYDNVDVYYSHFSNNEMVASFEPFLTIIKNCYIKYYSDKSIDEYLSLFDVYSLHRSFFKSYIESGSCERYEPYVLDDIGYEKKKMFESMTHIIIELSKQYPMLIIIDNIHMVTQSTITFLNQLIDNPDNKNIGIFAAYNDLKHTPSVTSDTWAQYIKIATTKHFVYEGGFYESKEDTEELSKFVFNGKRAYEYLLKLRLMYCAVDLEQADFYLQKIHEKLSNEKMNLDYSRFCRESG